VLVIDGNNNNDVGRFTRIVCISITTTKTQTVYRQSVHGKKNIEDTEEKNQESQKE
jgi:hypothetical protein